MAALRVSVRRIVATCGFAVIGATSLITGATGVAGAPVEAPAYLADCPAGEHLDAYTTRCVPFLVPRSACPPGVHGSECESSIQDPSGPIGGVAEPHMPAPPPASGPEQQLEEDSTPGY